MEIGGFNGAGGNVVDAAPVRNLKTYRDGLYGDIEVDVDYQYKGEDVKRLVLKMPQKISEASGKVPDNFIFGEVISNDSVRGASYDNGSLIEKYSEVVADDDLKGKTVTIAFPNCNNGHWRLFLMQFDPADSVGTKKFTIIDSLQDNAENVQTIFENNIVPIFKDCGLDEVLGIDDRTPCEMISLGLQKTGIEGEGGSANRQDCGPRMLHALELCAMYGVDELRDSSSLEALLTQRGAPSPNAVKSIRDDIAELQIKLFENEEGANANKKLVGDILGDKTTEGGIVLGQHFELLQKDFDYRNNLTVLQNRLNDGENVSDEMKGLIKTIQDVDDLMAVQVLFLKSKLAQSDGADSWLNEYIESEKRAIEIRSEIKLLGKKLEPFDEQNLEFALSLRGQDAVTLAKMACDEDVVDGQDMINYQFDGVDDFYELKERVIGVESAAQGYEVDDADISSDDGSVGIDDWRPLTVSDATPAVSNTTPDVSNTTPAVSNTTPGFDIDAILREVEHGSDDDLDVDFDVDETFRWFEDGAISPSPTSVGTDLARGGLVIDQARRAVFSPSGPAVRMVSKVTPSTSGDHEVEPRLHPRDPKAKVVSSRPANRTSEDGGQGIG